MRILFLQKRILFPADRGGRIRTLNIVRYLAQWHDVTYLCNTTPDDEPHLEEMQALGVRLETRPFESVPRENWKFYWLLAGNCFSQIPFSVAREWNPAILARAEQLLAEDRYDLIICDFLDTAPIAMGLNGQPRVLFQHNVEAQIFERHAVEDRGWLRRRLMGSQWRKMQRFEQEAGRQFDAVIAVSEQDRKIFEQQYGWDHVHVVDTAVDVDYFSPNGSAKPQMRVVSVAAMDWLPNEDGVRHFVEEIWPDVRRSHPEATFQIVGRNPSRGVRRLEQAPGVEVVGTVPDVRPYLAEAAVVVVPLLVGGGTRIKVFEAMAMAKPIVSTSIGAEGLKVNPGKDIVLADTPKTFAAAVAGLLSDRDHREQIGQAARRLVTENFAAENVARQFEAICKKVV